MKGVFLVVLCCDGGGPEKEVKEIIKKEEKIKLSAMQSKGEEGGEVWVLFCLTCPPTQHTTYSQTHTLTLFLSLTLLQLQLQKPLPHCLFLPFVSVPPMQLSMSPASAPSSHYLQMGVESYFEFLVII